MRSGCKRRTSYCLNLCPKLSAVEQTIVNPEDQASDADIMAKLNALIASNPELIKSLVNDHPNLRKSLIEEQPEPGAEPDRVLQ